MQDPIYMQDEAGNEKAISKIIGKYLRHWKWFLLSVLICLTIAYVKLRYTTPQYKATAKILVRDEQKGGLNSELSAFADLGLVGGVKNNVDNEIEILNSTTLIEKTVKKLQFNIVCTSLGKIRNTEAYKESQPIELQIVNATDAFYKMEQIFGITILSNSSFELVDAKGKNRGSFRFGTPIVVDEARIAFQKTPFFNLIHPQGKGFKIVSMPIENAAAVYGGVLKVEALSKTSSVVNLSVNSAVPKKAADFLDGLIAIYNEEAINDKNQISENTLKFIQERLNSITTELGSEENKAKGFKQANQLVDISSNAKIYLDNFSNLDKMLIETETKLRVAEIMMDFMKHKSRSELVPNEIIPSEKAAGLANPLIQQYNNLVLQNNRLLKDGKKSNATLVNIDQQLTDLERDIVQSISQYKSKLVVEKGDLTKQYDLMSGKLSQIPTQEQEYRVIERQQKIKEGIYLYLIQKREETAISLSVTEPNAKIIDAGRAGGGPISPNRNMFYLVGLFLGVGIPFGILFIIFLLDDKIYNSSDVEDQAKGIPVLGEIPNVLNNQEEDAQKLEAFRTLVNNTNFITPYDANEVGKAIFVTSAKKGEGKTFVAFNIANSFASLDKKTILIGTDFRNPQLHKFLDQNKSANKGLSNYLHNNSYKWRDLIIPVVANGFAFDLLLAGDIPPNPTLLLSGMRFADLMEELKKEYDIIVVDTAPTLLVSDTLIISKYADTTLLVARSGVTEKKLVQYATKLKEENKINNPGFVVNAIDYTNTYGYGYGYGYNYGYGYGYGLEEAAKPWFQKGIIGRFYKKVFKRK